MNVTGKRLTPDPQTDAGYVTSRIKGVDDYIPPATSSARPIFLVREREGALGSASASPFGLETWPVLPEDYPPATADARAQFHVTTKEQQAKGTITVPGRFGGRLIDGAIAVTGMIGMSYGTPRILQTEALTPTQRTLLAGCYMLGMAGTVIMTIYRRRKNE